MIFENCNDIICEEDEVCNIYEANECSMLKRLPDVAGCTYSISLLSSDLKLVPMSKKYKYDDNEAIVFSMEKKKKRLDFVGIYRNGRRKIRNEFDIRLLVVIKRDGLVLKERSRKFKVILKRNNIRSIDERKTKDMSISSYWDLSNDLQSQLDEASNGDLCTTIAELSSDEDALGIPDLGSCDRKTYCLMFNFIDFINDKQLSQRCRSIQNVISITNVFGNILKCEMKGVINATRKDFFEDMREFVSEIKFGCDQVVIFVMSHGSNGGFYTTDGFISKKEFHGSMKHILNDPDICKLLIKSYCQENTACEEIVLVKNSFYATTRSISSSSSDSDHSASTSPSTSSGEECVYDNVSSAKVQSPKGYLKYPNTMIGYSAALGEVSYGGENGSFYIHKMMQQSEDCLNKHDSVNLVEIISDVNNEIGNMKFKFKGQIVRQRPWAEGNLEDGFCVQRRQGLKVDDMGPSGDVSMPVDGMRGLSFIHGVEKPPAKEDSSDIVDVTTNMW